MKKNRNNYLAWILAVLLAANLIVMVFFTVTVDNKLEEAIGFATPQVGTLTLITANDCPQCRDLEPLKEYIISQNVEITDEQTFSAETPEGRDLIDKFAIEKLPTLIFQSEKKVKTQLKTAIEKGSREIDDNTLLWEQAFPPYFDLKNNFITGLVEVIFLTDKSCSECYDVVQVQKEILDNFGVVIVTEKPIDISDEEGKQLLKKYAINKVPTIILSEEAKFYEQLSSVWGQVGTIEEDGSFVFREMSVIEAKYRDLETGQIIINNDL